MITMYLKGDFDRAMVQAFTTFVRLNLDSVGAQQSGRTQDTAGGLTNISLPLS